jgi:hypothetical protein
MSKKEDKSTIKKVKEDSGPASRGKTYKYSELENEGIDEDTVQKVMNRKIKSKGVELHAFDGISDADVLTEQQVE